MRIRLKLAAIVLSVVMLMLGTAYLAIGPALHATRLHLQSDVETALQQLTALSRSDGRAASFMAEHLANDQRLISAMSADCDDVTRRDDCLNRQHRDASAAIETWLLESGTSESRSIFPAVDPTIVISARTDGFVVARFIGDVSDWWGDNAVNLIEQSDLVARVVADQRPQWGTHVWSEGAGAGETSLLVGVAPIRQSDGAIIGIAFLGWPLNDLMASMKQWLPGWTTLYTRDGSITGASSDELVAPLQGMTFRPVDATAGEETDFANLLSTDRSGRLFRGTRPNRDILIAAVAFPGSIHDSERIGLAVVADSSTDSSSASTPLVWLLVGGLVVLVLGLVGIAIITRGYVNPLLRVEHGIQQVVAGNRDYVWQTERSSFFAQLAHSLNVMSAILQGKSPPDDNDSVEDKSWEAMVHFAELETTGQRISKQDFGKPRIPASNPARDEASELASEPKDVYLSRLFNEYTTARSSVGLESERISLERFTGQVEKNAALFKRKYDCRDVRFEVVVKDEKVVLKPIPIK